jgi:hypothetical protein
MRGPESLRLSWPCFPSHKLVERLPGSVDYELDDGCVVDKSEERCLVGN